MCSSEFLKFASIHYTYNTIQFRLLQTISINIASSLHLFINRSNENPSLTSAPLHPSFHPMIHLSFSTISLLSICPFIVPFSYPEPLTSLYPTIHLSRSSLLHPSFHSKIRQPNDLFNDLLLLYIISCNRSCGSCQLRYFQ